MGKTCFVVMGYGTKIDFKTGRKLNLDMTYNNILKPMIEELNMKCIRSDEIIHSGIIDRSMFDYLLSADVVIADISTYNSNVFYELGIRHAVKPYTTIIISEKELECPFDIEHSVIYRYEHLGKDIGYTEVMRFKEELKTCLKEILANPSIDSPVYTHISNLNPPKVNDKCISKKNKGDSAVGESLKTIVTKAEQFLSNSNFNEAKTLFKVALEIDRNSDYLLQRLILATYKDKQEDEEQALNEALSMIKRLKPDVSNDPETLGLASAINKRLWDIKRERVYLDKAINYSERGFYISNDYYNGINLAYLFNVRANINADAEEVIADRVIAKRIREKVIEICLKIISTNVDERDDSYWVMATIEEAYFGIGREKEYLEFKEKAISNCKEEWQRNSTEEQISKLKILLNYNFKEN